MRTDLAHIAPPRQEKKFYIQGMVRWVLFNESHRRVLRRQDIVKAGQSPRRVCHSSVRILKAPRLPPAVLTDGRGRHFTSLLPKVQKILRDVLGLDLVALRPKESATGKGELPVSSHHREPARGR